MVNWYQYLVEHGKKTGNHIITNFRNMPVQRPFNLNKWIEDHRHLLKPPVGNQCVYKEAGDFIVMVVGGPNSRKDFHFNEGEELFYQLEGDVNVRIQEDGKIVDIPIKAGD